MYGAKGREDVLDYIALVIVDGYLQLRFPIQIYPCFKPLIIILFHLFFKLTCFDHLEKVDD